VNARRCPFRIGNWLAAAGKHGLHDVPLGHGPFAAGEQCPNVRERPFIEHQLRSCQPGHCFSRQIVGRRAQPAAGDHEISPLDGLPQREHVFLQVIGHRRMADNADAQVQQSLAEPLAVGIQPLAGGHLIANRNYFGLHGRLARVR